MSEIPFPEFPSSKGAILVPLFNLIFVFGFTYIEYFQGFKTNPVIFFSVWSLFNLLIIAISVASEDKGYKGFIDALGINVGKTWKIPLLIIIGILVGAFMFSSANTLSVMGLQPLPTGVEWSNYLNTQTNLEQGNKVTVTLLWFMAVAVGEEIATFFMLGIIANVLAAHAKLAKTDSIIYGAILSRIIWAMGHYVAYTIIQSAPLPSYIIAVIFGLIFTILSLVFYFKTGISNFDRVWYVGETVIIASIIAHAVYDIGIGLKYLGITLMTYIPIIVAPLAIATGILFYTQEKQLFS